jgi:DNA polymerase
MGGTGIATDTREVASALRWWLEMGVDVAVQENPRDWLQSRPPAEPVRDEAPAHLPETLEAFREWLATSPDSPLASPRSKPVLPKGKEAAEIMLISEPPTRDELATGQPIGGAAAELMQRMLQAIGLAGTDYSANLACFHSAATRLSPEQLEACAAAARRHVALVRPRRLLLLGEMPARALLGKALPQARGHVYKIEGIRTVATFHPRQLLKRPQDKRLAWEDLLLLMDDER